MKVSERISKIWAVVDDTDVYPLEANAIIKRQLLQLEAEIADALIAARQRGREIGYQAGYRAKAVNGTNSLQVVRQEWRTVCSIAYHHGHGVGYRVGYKAGAAIT